MYRIIDGRGTGKTSRLLLLAKEHNGLVVCKDPEKMKEKAYGYGITGIDFINYWDYLADNLKDFNIVTEFSTPVFIDEIDSFLKVLYYNIQGYTISED